MSLWQNLVGAKAQGTGEMAMPQAPGGPWPQEEHASAVQEARALEAKATDDIADLNSELERARSEFSAEIEGREADNKQAESAADELKVPGLGWLARFIPSESINSSCWSGVQTSSKVEPTQKFWPTPNQGIP